MTTKVDHLTNRHLLINETTTSISTTPTQNNNDSPLNNKSTNQLLTSPPPPHHQQQQQNLTKSFSTLTLNSPINMDDNIKVQIYYNNIITVIYLTIQNIHLDKMCTVIRTICKFDIEQQFTIKWVDEEGDPCTISSQEELDESIRLYFLNKETELIIHVFPSVPDRPGSQCSGEDRSIYRRGARRWRKIYLVNGHKYQAKRFARTALCKVCSDRIWGLGRQGYKCLDCKIMVHKRCHKFIKLNCDDTLKHQQQNQQQNIIKTPLPSPKTPTISTKPPQIPNTSSTVRTSIKKINDEPPQSRKSSVKVVVKQQNDENNEQTPDNSPQADTSNQQTTKQHATAISKQMSLEDFDLIRVIGRGSYAKVFLVEYKRTTKCYAMKVIKKSMVNDDEDIDWVQTEKHVFEQATNHPFLVGLHSCFQTESRLFFVIEYLCGGDLMYHMQRKRKLPEDHARFYAAEITIALDFLHSKGIIYRDLKLDNVLLDIEGHVKLTDYGMCKEGLTKGEKTSTFCGTPNYIAPEMLRGEEYSFSVDWWALGVLMYELMAGRSPFELNENPSENPDLNTEDHLFQVILEKPIRIPRSLSVKAASILKSFLQKLPDERLGTHNGLREIQQHQYFKQIDWILLEQKLIQPPYKPQVLSERDLTNIDELFTKEAVVLTPDSPSTLARIQQNEFEGFEYINPLILSDELQV
jgi:atypical protein kinase C iota type